MYTSCLITKAFATSVSGQPICTRQSKQIVLSSLICSLPPNECLTWNPSWRGVLRSRLLVAIKANPNWLGWKSFRLALATTEGAKEIRSKGVSLDEEVVVGGWWNSHLYPLWNLHWAVGGWGVSSQVLFCIVFWPFKNSRSQLQVSLGPGAIDNSFAQTSKRPVALDCRQWINRRSWVRKNVARKAGKIQMKTAPRKALGNCNSRSYINAS